MSAHKQRIPRPSICDPHIWPENGSYFQSKPTGIHPASVRCVDVPPSMATHRLRSRRPVATTRLRMASLLHSVGNHHRGLIHPSAFHLHPFSPAWCHPPPGYVIGGPSGPARLRRVRSMGARSTLTSLRSFAPRVLRTLAVRRCAQLAGKLTKLNAST